MLPISDPAIPLRCTLFIMHFYQHRASGLGMVSPGFPDDNSRKRKLPGAVGYSPEWCIQRHSAWPSVVSAGDCVCLPLIWKCRERLSVQGSYKCVPRQMHLHTIKRVWLAVFCGPRESAGSLLVPPHTELSPVCKFRLFCTTTSYLGSVCSSACSTPLPKVLPSIAEILQASAFALRVLGGQLRFWHSVLSFP